MSKIYENLLAEYKKANKERKQKLAEKNGFSSGEEYLKHLEVLIKGGIPKRKVGKILKPKIHSVIVLDASGSMAGGKYDNSKKGILKEIEDCQTNKNADFTFTLIEFIQSGKVKVHFKLSESPEEIVFSEAVGANTPLYSTVLTYLKDINDLVPKEEKVLFSVFTDGFDNSSRSGDRTDTNKLIKKLEKENFTVTFVATESDMAGIIRDLSLEESNTLTVTNNALGFETAFTLRGQAVAMYSTSVSLGEDVSKGFYKKIAKL